MEETISIDFVSTQKPEEPKPEFEFDPNKSQANKNKHGLDFVEAQVLWLDSQKVEIPARTENEPRFVVRDLRFDNVPSGWSGSSTERFSGWDIIPTQVPYWYNSR